MLTEQPLLIDSGISLQQAGLVHRVWQPSVTMNNDAYPTVVMVHGRAGSEDVTWIFGRAIPQPALLVAPRAIYVDPADGGYSWHIRDEEEWSALESFDPAIDALDRFISALPDLYGANLKQLYFLGFSQGAALIYAYAMRHPQKVQAAATLVGFMPADAEYSPALKNLKDKPILQLVGRNDSTIPLSQSQRCAQTLILAGARLDYREYETGHKLNAQGMRDLGKWWQGAFLP